MPYVYNKNKDMDIQKFRQDFLSSGLTQSKYGKKVGISASMVSYYLSKTKNKKTSAPVFSSLTINESSSGVIRIKTSAGVEIEIPL